MRVRSGDLGGHSTGPRRPIQCPGNCWSSHSRISKRKCGGAPSCWKNAGKSPFSSRRCNFSTYQDNHTRWGFFECKRANSPFIPYPAPNYDFLRTLNFGVRYPMCIGIIALPHILPVHFTSNIKICLIRKKDGTKRIRNILVHVHFPLTELSAAATFASWMGATC